MPALNGTNGGYYQPPKVKPISTSPLAAAASNPNSANPFGLSAGANLRAGIGVGGASAPIAAAAAATPKVPAAPTAPTAPAIAPHPAAAPPTPGTYDINTDPALQQVTALTGLSDSDANAAALKQRVQQVIAYGDPTLAAAVLGSSDPNVQAASANPNSTVAQINTQYGQNLHNLDEQLNQDNLGYSGYRITQEQQAATDKANQLANAASNEQSNLDTIDGNLSSTLATNQAQRIQAASDAANRLAAAASTASASSGGATGSDLGTAAGGDGTPTPLSVGTDVRAGIGIGGALNSDSPANYALAANTGSNPLAQAIGSAPAGNDWTSLPTLGNDWTSLIPAPKKAAPVSRRPLL